MLAAFLPAACSKEDPQETSYYERAISPILTTSCVRTNTGAGCHVSTPKGNAFGNLDTSSFEGIDRRRDLLADYGPYGQPAFLIKNVPDFQVELQSFDGQKTVVTTDIKHAGSATVWVFITRAGTTTPTLGIDVPVKDAPTS